MQDMFQTVLRLPLLISLLLLLFSCFPLPVPAEEMKPEDLYQKVLQSTFTLYVETADGACGGTGFLSIKDGIGVTAWHVMNGAIRATARFSSGEEFDVSGLIDKDEKRDVCLIRIKVADRPLLSLAAVEPAVGNKAYAIGAPKGLEFTISDGMISQVRTLDGIKQYQFTCAISPGNSGGPLVNVAGEVLGVVSWTVIDGQNLNFAVPISYVRGLDATLPTRPFDQVKPDPVITDSKVVTDEEADQILVETLYTMETFFYAYSLFERRTSHGIPSMTNEVYIAMEQLLTTIAKLKGARMTGKRDDARLFILDQVIAMQEGANCLNQAVIIAQRNDSWQGDPNNLWAQGLAILKMRIKRVPAESYQLLAESAAKMQLYTDFAIYLGVSPDRATYYPGIRFYVVDPSLIFEANKEGFAYRLGFRDEGRILAVNGKPFESMQGFLLTLQENLNKTLKVKVQRGGEEKTLTVRLPKKIPAEFLKK